MTQIPTKEQLQDFALKFENEIVLPLVNCGYDKYNVFDILNFSRQELRHSDFLAFLLDINKSGDIGLQFLRNFLVLLSKDIEPQLDFFDMLYGTLDKVNVYREVAVKYGRIDILIEVEITHTERQKIVIAIENKIDSGEHDNQLEKYKEFLSGKRYKDYAKIMLYLSPDKAPPSDGEWSAIDYEFIYSVLDRVNIENTDSTLKTLVDDYKKIIRSEFRMTHNDELKQKAIEIYKNNQPIFDFIYSCKPDWIEMTSIILCELLEDKGATIITENKNKGLVPTTKRGQVNIMFRLPELANYPTHYFQISVNDMLLVFRKNSTQNQCPQKWLLGDKQKSADAVKRYQELVFDTTKLQADCEQVIEQAFAKDGIIDKCLSSITK